MKGMYYDSKRIFFLVKFVYSEKATKFCEISTLLLSTVHTDKSKVEISQNFVAFSEYTNFKERIFFWCTEISCWQTNLPLYRAESFVPNLLIIRDQIPRCKRRQTYRNIRLLGIYQVCSNDCMHKWMSLLWTEHCARSVTFTFNTFAIIFLNKKL